MRVYYDILVTVVLVVQYLLPARLKKFSPRGKLISVVDTGECPYSMALIQDTDLVVTHPRAREFVFLTAGGTLHVTGRIKTLKSYFSLASSSTDGILAAVGSSSPEPPSIDLIAFDGEVGRRRGGAGRAWRAVCLLVGWLASRLSWCPKLNCFVCILNSACFLGQEYITSSNEQN